MRRPALVLFLPALAVAAPVPKAKEISPPIPMTVGDSREYEYLTDGKSSGGYTELVTEVEKQKDGSTHVTVKTAITGGETYTTTFAVSDGELSAVVVRDKKLAKPTLWLKLPLTAGSKWEDVNTKVEVAAEEEVEVAAGKFKAMKVEKTTGQGTWTTWYAPGVGIVKSIATVTKTELELKTHKPGK